MINKGGYIIVDVSSDTLYDDLTKATALNKAVLIYGDDEPYFADSVTTDGSSFDVVKGGQTINVASDGTITKTGEKQQHLYQHSIYIMTNDTDDKGLYIFFNIINDKSSITKDDVINFLKSISSTYYQCSGYGTDNPNYMIVAIKYEESVNTFNCLNATGDIDVEISDMNKATYEFNSTQLF